MGLDTAEYDRLSFEAQDGDDPLDEFGEFDLDDDTMAALDRGETIDTVDAGISTQQLALIQRVERALPPLVTLKDQRTLLEALSKPDLSPKKLKALERKVGRTLEQSVQVMDAYHQAVFSPQAQEVFPQEQLQQMWHSFCMQTPDLKARRMWLKGFPSILREERRWKQELEKEPEAVKAEFETLHAQQGAFVDRRTSLDMARVAYKEVNTDYGRALKKAEKHFSPQSLEEFTMWFQSLKSLKEMRDAIRDLPREVEKREHLTKEFEKLPPDVQEQNREAFTKLSRHEKVQFLRSLKESQKDPLTLEYTKKIMNSKDYSEQEKVTAVRRFRVLPPDEKKAILVLLPGRMRERARLSEQFEQLSDQVRARNADFYKLSKQEKQVRLRFLTQGTVPGLSQQQMMAMHGAPGLGQMPGQYGLYMSGQGVSLSNYRKTLETRLAGEQREKAKAAIGEVMQTADGRLTHLLGEVLQELRAEESKRGFGADMSLRSRAEASLSVLDGGRKGKIAKSYLDRRQGTGDGVVFDAVRRNMGKVRTLDVGLQATDSDTSQNLLTMRKEVNRRRGERERGIAPTGTPFRLIRREDGQERRTTAELGKDIQGKESQVWGRVVDRLVAAGVVAKDVKQEEVAALLKQMFGEETRQNFRKEAA